MVRRLYRSRTEKVMGGVCGGMAEYFNIDPTLLRVGFVVLALVNGLGIIAYLAMWLVFPRQVPQEEPAETPAGPGTAQPASKEEPLFKPRPQRAYWLGIVLIALGLLWLFNNNLGFLANVVLPVELALLWQFARGIWPLLLIVGGIIVVVARRRK